MGVYRGAPRRVQALLTRAVAAIILADMSLLANVTAAPIAHEPAHGAETRAAFGDLPQTMGALIEGVAGCSPYLRRLLLRETDWLRSVWALPADGVLAALTDDVTSAGFDALSKELRHAKARLALYVALADLGGWWSLEQVTATLSAFADFAVQRALSTLVTAEIERGKLPDQAVQDAENAAGMVVLAMGKLGANELNYSSDIDLIVLFDDAAIDAVALDATRAAFIRITKRLCKMLSEVRSEGYVFRTDLRLRPDPSVTPVCISFSAAENYYESKGRTWERAAFIKARPCAGDIDAGWRFLTTMRPFVWRKHLDYAAIEDAHDMRLRIRDHKGLGGPITLRGHNMKLGRGGIREIEFFTQTRQIIAGGRDAVLRVRETVVGLAALAKQGWISQETSDALTGAYRHYRLIEHRLQMINDAQTHDLPGSDEGFQRLCHFCGYRDVDAYCVALGTQLEAVHTLTESFFAPRGGGAAAETLSQLSDGVVEMMDNWPSLPALRTDRAAKIFNRLRPAILRGVARASNPDEALIQLDGFLAGLPAGVQLFSLFEANPHLIDLLVEICAGAPDLARYIAHNAQVFDAVLDGSFFAPMSDVAGLVKALQARLKDAPDYEARLNAARRWMKEVRFCIGVQHLKAVINSAEAGQCYAQLAEACLVGLLPVVSDNFAVKYGPVPGRGFMVLGMGSLGAGDLTVTSDLDIIVIYDGDGVAESAGARQLSVPVYYARLTQALVTALASPMAEGRLYEIDMRLRPSGRKGPVAVSLSGYKAYQNDEAWTWEHLALTRARAVAGDAALGREIEAFRRKLLSAKSGGTTILADVADMRARLRAAEGASGALDWNVKAGAGGLLDISLIAQAAVLIAGSAQRDTAGQLICGTQHGWWCAQEAQELNESYALFKTIQQVARLVGAQRFDDSSVGQGAVEMLLAETGADSVKALLSRVGALRGTAGAIIDRVLAQD